MFEAAGGGNVNQGEAQNNRTNRSQSDGVFNLTIDEVKMVVRYRTLSPHQQRGVLQAIDVIRPAAAKNPTQRHPFN